MKISGKPAISRADLIRLYGAFGADALIPASFVAGYCLKDETKKPTPDDAIDGSKPGEPEKGEGDLPPKATSSETNISIPFWRPRSCEFLNPDEMDQQAPKAFIEAVALDDESINADPDKHPPVHQPLCPWARMWPFQRSILGEIKDLGAIDIPKVIQSTAEMRPMKRLPRIYRPGWARRCVLLIDADTRLIPFLQDARQLYRNVLKVRGRLGLDLQLFENGPSGPVSRPGKAPLSHLPFKNPEPGTPILIISDLGLFSRDAKLKNDWVKFGHKLRQSNFQPVVLTPAPYRLWTRELTSLYRMACWDRGMRLPKRGAFGKKGVGRQPLETKRDGTERLLALLAPAIRVEPALLRAVRMLLPVDQCDAGNEAAVWNHDHVRRGYTGFSFDPAHVAIHRADFVRNNAPDIQKSACKLIESHHRHLSPAVGKEEQLIADTLLQGKPSEEAECFFWSSLRTLSTPEFREMAGLESWIKRLMHRHGWDPPMWQSHALCALWAKANQDAWTRGKIVLPEGMDPACATWVFAPEGSVRYYTLFRKGQGFIAANRSEFGSFGGAIFPGGSPVVDLVSSNGVLQVREIETRHSHEYAVNLNHKERVPVDVPMEGRVELITTHQKIILDCQARPSWATGWGRDEKGLFLILQEKEKTRHIYWFPPGKYPVGSWTASGPEIVVEQGFWWDQDDLAENFDIGFKRPSWATDFGLDGYGIYADFQIKSVSQRMRWIMPGKFLMGSPETEPERYEDEHRHEVILTQGYWLGETTCTQAFWKAVMGNNPSRFKGDDRPVENVSWNECQDFIKKLNAAIPGLDVELPTEAQWEYACRAGTVTPFHFGETIGTNQANFDENYPYDNAPQGEYHQETVSVKTFPCNAWGLYEMHGNVYEWCADWIGPYPEDASATRRDPMKATAVSCAAVPGSATAGSCALPAVTGSRLTSATTTSACGLPEVRPSRQARRPAEPDKASLPGKRRKPKHQGKFSPA
nr:formylglycine-generating enzyme family protein [Desulfosarcina cetonica]